MHTRAADHKSIATWKKYDTDMMQQLMLKEHPAQMLSIHVYFPVCLFSSAVRKVQFQQIALSFGQFVTNFTTLPTYTVKT